MMRLRRPLAVSFASLLMKSVLQSSLANSKLRFAVASKHPSAFTKHWHVHRCFRTTTQSQNSSCQIDYRNCFFRNIHSEKTYAYRSLRAGTRFFASSTNDADETPESDMSALYQEWTLEQDQLLYENRKESLPALAALLGRGLRGVETRLQKLTNVNSPAYERLFSLTSSGNGNNYNMMADKDGDKKKLVPAKEILRRIQWDYSLTESDFSILYYDRVEDEVLESAMDAPNESIAGPQERWVDALPEHRIVGIMYKERIVWDREKRIDRVFGSTTSETIDIVMKQYPEWKEKKDAAIAWNRQRQAEVTHTMQRMLGQNRFAMLKSWSSDLQQIANENSQDSESLGSDLLVPKNEVEKYVKSSLQLFREARDDPMSCPEPSLIPMTDILALESLSELVALLPDSALRPTILSEIVTLMNKLEGKSGTGTKSLSSSKQGAVLPELREEDLEENHVRGSGPGGQKINKTSNKVILVHMPTGLRVECQDTRSLQQNRKIARKRLRLKLDEYLNGSQSRASIKADKAATKKAKAKARSKARQRKKKQKTEAQVRSDEE